MLPNRSMPTAAIIPVLHYDDVPAAIGWLCDTFGFTERWRVGAHRAQLGYGDSAIAVTEHPADAGPPAGHEVMVRVADVDDHHATAREHGAQVLGDPADHAYGERQYSAVDLGGHRWTFTQTIADVAPEDWGGTASR